MRYQINKLQKKQSTKDERRFMELLKANRIKFRTKVKIQGHEVDFLIGNNIVEIRNYKQNPIRNNQLLKSGYNLLYFNTNDILSKDIKNFLKFLT
jgi:very-short-patch-repair endonuclease